MDTTLTTLPIDSISTNPARPRQTISQKTLSQLADSIRTFGVLNPLLVNSKGGRYHIICGERRYRAAKIAGLTEVPCVVVSVDPKELAMYSLAENLQRDPLNLIDQGFLISKLHHNLEYSLIEIGESTGLTMEEIEQRLLVLELPDKVRRSYLDGVLTDDDVLELVSIGDPIHQEALYKRKVAK